MAQLTLLLRKAKRSNEIKLDLSGKEIQFLPNDIFTLGKLEILNLSNNRIATLDPKIEQLTHLRVLDLSDNNLTELPKELMALNNLEMLVVHGNPLSKQFRWVQEEEASTNIQKALKKCFGLNSGEESKKQQAPSWLNEGPSIMRDSKAFGKVVELESQFKSEQKKVKQLQHELQKLNMGKKSGGDSFTIDLDPIMQIMFNELQIFEQISMGGYSTIHRGCYKGLQVAVKKNFNPKINEELLRQFSNQIGMLAKFRHPNIVLLIGICSKTPNLAIVTEFIETGSLYDLLHKRKANLKDSDKKKIVKQVLSSVSYLHGHGIVHKDIKSHNFLVDQNYTVKLCDFGLARHKDVVNQGPMQFSGTPVYMAQQLFLKKQYDQFVDIFALGTLLYEIYTNEIPYNGLDPADIKQKLLKDHTLPNRGNINKSILQKINDCRNPNIKQRPQAIKLLNLDCW